MNPTNGKQRLSLTPSDFWERSSHPPAGGVGCDFQTVATELHAAPAASALLAGVVEMQYALLTFANALAIRFSK